MKDFRGGWRVCVRARVDFLRKKMGRSRGGGREGKEGSKGGWENVRRCVTVTPRLSCCCPESKPWKPDQAGPVPWGYLASPSQSPCSGTSWWWTLGRKQEDDQRWCHVMWSEVMSCHVIRGDVMSCQVSGYIHIISVLKHIQVTWTPGVRSLHYSRTWYWDFWNHCWHLFSLKTYILTHLSVKLHWMLISTFHFNNQNSVGELALQ